MSLQARLTLFLTLALVLPLAAAGFLVQRVMAEEVEERALLTLRPALQTSRALYEDRSGALRQRVEALARSPRLEALLAGPAAELERYLGRELRPGVVDFLVITDRDEALVGSALAPARYVQGFTAPGPHEIMAARAGVHRGFARSPSLDLPGDGTRETAILGGFWIDADMLVGGSDGRVELAVVVDERAVAATEPIDRPATVPLAEGRFEVDVGGRGIAEAERIGPDTALVAWVPTSPIRALADRLLGSLVVLLVLSLLAFAVLAYLLAKLMTRPLQQLASGAQALTEGRFDHRLLVKAKGEIGELATAFNEMASRLSETIAELSTSRAQLQLAVQQVAKAFRSTHNMEQILEALLDTAVQAVGADAGVLWRFSPTRRDLYPAIRRNVAEEPARVPVGRGLVGLAAERGTALTEEPGEQDPDVSHPDHPVALAVPYHSQDRVQGVIVLLREDPQAPFGRQDLNTAQFLAQQASVAIENVALHQEARRLSLSDGLTGVWNRRFLQMQFRQVLAASVRFNRPFSVLMLDLDEFKSVNDTHGHQRGDATLIEFTKRVSSTLREVDTVARYGGEEFVCLLPETDYDGAFTTAEKIRDAIKSEPFGEPGEEPFVVTVSIGIASYPIHGRSFSALIEAADQALYRAKQEGRDRVVVAGDLPPNLTSVG